MEPLPEKNEAHGDDRLSNLPDAILHQILLLSDLEIFDVVKLGVLSKRWNRLWIIMPYFNIHVDAVKYSQLRGVPRDHTSVEIFRSFINWVLTRQGESRLVRHRLRSGALFHELQILRWLRVVVERNVQELEITFLPLAEFRLPLFIAVNDSLRVLKITIDTNMMQRPSVTIFSHVIQLPSVVRLNQLTSLELNDVEFSDCDMLQRLFSGCCSLESLELSECSLQSYGFLDFSSTHLKELIICFDDAYTDDLSNFEIKVSCPNPIFFKYLGPVAMNYILENVSSLETAWFNFSDFCVAVHSILKEVHNVIDLNCDWFVVRSLSSVIDELIRCPISFPKVKFLSVSIATVNYQTQVMFHLLDHCPNLEVLTLVSKPFVHDWEEEYWELQSEGIISWKSHPHLKTIKFVDFRGSELELDFLRFLFKNAKSLERMDIIPDSYYFYVEVINKVLMLPKASSGIVVTFIGP